LDEIQTHKDEHLVDPVKDSYLVDTVLDLGKEILNKKTDTEYLQMLSIAMDNANAFHLLTNRETIDNLIRFVLNDNELFEKYEKMITTLQEKCNGFSGFNTDAVKDLNSPAVQRLFAENLFTTEK
jgi:hypothetical protein